MDVFPNPIAVIIPRYVRISNDHAAHLEFTQFCMSIISQQMGGKGKEKTELPAELPLISKQELTGRKAPSSLQTETTGGT